MTDPTPTRAEVAVCYACGALPCDQAHTPKPHIQHTDDINDMVLLGMARDELFAENQALRDRAEAAEAESAEWRDQALRKADALTAARRAEAAAWNDAIEAAAEKCDVVFMDHIGDLIRAIGEDIRALRRAAPAHDDDLAVDRFAAAMKAKLAKKRNDGRGGWSGPECSEDMLSRMLRDHVSKGDPVDVANFAMMLHQRGERIAQAAPTEGEA